MARPTRKAATMLLVASLLVVAGTTAQAGWLFVLAAGVVGPVVGSLLMPQGLSRVSVARSVPAVTQAGTEVRVGLSARCTGTGTGAIRLTDAHPAFGNWSAFSKAVPRDAEVRVEAPRLASRRGVFREGPILVETAAPFGLARSRRSIVVESPVVVTPRWVELGNFPLLEPSSFPAETLHERARTGGGQDYLGIREYRSGDPLRHVHWRSSARAGGLIVREYSEQVQGRVVIVLTGADHGAPPDSSFETATEAAASIALYALGTGHPVDLARGSASGEVERIGDVDRRGALRWLAAAAPADVDPVDVLGAALGRAGRRATVVLIATTAGRAGAGLARAAGTAQAAGARAIVVAVRSLGWDAPDDSDVLSGLGGRTVVRVVDRGGDLRGSLER